ncbi:thioredoxin reductase [Bacteriovorax stolpii]|nr:NAD(P)/FAD-dependent oxidoreductase [Bacteriovorax stolpii]TDP55550.1 thioredoxin reductase [Bacteriovorax stolpii]
MKTLYDVLIIGGGPAGLSAALAISRVGRTALVCDSQVYRNAAAKHMQNFPSRDGMSPLELKELIKNDINKYEKVDYAYKKVIDIKKEGPLFVGYFEDGQSVQAKKVILAHGVKDNLETLPNLREYWGETAIHCPYCHGYELKGSDFAIVGEPEYTLHIAGIVKPLSSSISIFANGSKRYSEENLKFIQEKKIEFHPGRITNLSGLNHKLESLTLDNGDIYKKNAMMIRPPTSLSSDLGIKLGCALTSEGNYLIEMKVKSSVPGVFIAGDLAEMAHSVLIASTSGSMAGAFACSEIGHAEL